MHFRAGRALKRGAVCFLVPCATLALIVCVESAARAACTTVDLNIASEQVSLRSLDTLRSLVPADGSATTSVELAHRLDLLALAHTDTVAAETIRETTPGGCSDLQQLYGTLMTTAWVNLELAYLKPSLDPFVNADDCRSVSQIQTLSAVAGAYEIMQRSLISWNPVNPQTIATRAHVTELVTDAAGYLSIALPAPNKAEDLARVQKFRLDVARSRATSDCAGAMPAFVPPSIARQIFAGS